MGARWLLAFIATVLAAGGAARAGGSEVHASRFVLPATEVDGLRVGEVSGLAWDADEQVLHAVSDQGKLYALHVERQGDSLRSVRVVSAAMLVDAATGDGQSLSGRRFNAEGLAVQGAHNGRRGDSTLLVALEERPPQIARFDSSGRLLDRLAVPPPADDMAHYRKKGRGLESVVMHPEYGVMTAPEAPLMNSPAARHTIYSAGHTWSFTRHASDSRLKGIEVLPDGRLLVLERSRPGPAKDVQVASLRRVDLAHCDAQGVCQTSLLAELPAGPENFEGLTLLDARHALIASDNGGLVGQGTTFVLVALP